MFHLDSNTARPIVSVKEAALDFWKAYIDIISFGYAEGKINSSGVEQGSRSVVTTGKLQKG